MKGHGINTYSRRPENNPFVSKKFAEAAIKYLYRNAGGVAQALIVRYDSAVSGTRSRETWDALSRRVEETLIKSYLMA